MQSPQDWGSLFGDETVADAGNISSKDGKRLSGRQRGKARSETRKRYDTRAGIDLWCFCLLFPVLLSHALRDTWSDHPDVILDTSSSLFSCIFLILLFVSDSLSPILYFITPNWPLNHLLFKQFLLTTRPHINEASNDSKRFDASSFLGFCVRHVGCDMQVQRPNCDQFIPRRRLTALRLNFDEFHETRCVNFRIISLVQMFGTNELMSSHQTSL